MRSVLVLVLLLAIVLCSATCWALGEDSVDAAVGDTSTSQAYLGLAVGPLRPALTSHLLNVIGKGRGVLVEQVMDGTPAAKAGMKKYDIWWA